MRIFKNIILFVIPILYFLIVLPVSLFLRFIGKDLIPLELDKNKDSYWIKKNKEDHDRESFHKP